MPIDTNLEKLIINKNLTKEQFEQAIADGSISENDLSLVDDDNEGGSITLDTEMSDTSENGVQNKVIKSYVDSAVEEVNTKIDNVSDSAGKVTITYWE